MSMLRLQRKKFLISGKFLRRIIALIGCISFICIAVVYILKPSHLLFIEHQGLFILPLKHDDGKTEPQTGSQLDSNHPETKDRFGIDGNYEHTLVPSDIEHNNQPQSGTKILSNTTSSSVVEKEGEAFSKYAAASSGKAFPKIPENTARKIASDPTSKEQAINVLSEANPAKTLELTVENLSKDSLTSVSKGSKKQLATDYLRKVASYVPSIPLTYQRHIHGYKNSACASFPRFYYLQFNNVVWQHFQSREGASFYIYGAYYDDRPLLRAPVVRVLVMVNRVSPPSVMCQFWWPEALETTVIRAKKPIHVWKKGWGNFNDSFLQPFLITCSLTNSLHTAPPESVSLVSVPCENATNNVRIFNYRSPTKDGFAVCVKGLNFLQKDISVRLVEWIELLKLLGAHKIFFYELHIHPNVAKVLDHYVVTGFAEKTLLTLPGMQLNYPEMLESFFSFRLVTKRQNELIPYNDCFYKNIHRYKYVVLLDTDEVIVPLQAGNWMDLMEEVVIEARNAKWQKRGSFYASNVYFFDDALNVKGWNEALPKYMHMLQHVWRASNHTTNGSFAKSFFNTEKVLTLHNHHPMKCLKKHCFSYEIPQNMAQLQHYHKDCDTSLDEICDAAYKSSIVRDTSLWRFREPMVERTRNVLQKLGFL